MARSTTKETKIRNIIEKTGDNYKDQLKSL